MIQSVEIREKQIIKKIAATDPCKENQFAVDNNKSSVGAYYLGTKNEQNDLREFYSFLIDGVHQVEVSAKKIEKYYCDVKMRVMPYKYFYTDQLDMFKNAIQKFKNEDINLSLLHFDERSAGRVFLKFGDAKIDQEFQKLLLGSITEMVFTRKSDTLQIELRVVGNVEDNICNSLFKKKFDPHKIKQTFEEYVNKYNDDLGTLKFSIDFGKFINKGLVDIDSIFNEADGSSIFDTTHGELIKNQAKVYDLIYIDNSTLYEDVTTNNAPIEFLEGGYNKIYYGIPGVGKSYYIKNTVLASVPSSNVFRTTFFLDYTNSDFIGQIMPVVNGDKVEYKSIPGPFTKALTCAYEHPKENVYLVIEEINRGNAAAIFGDIFQLLDREDKTSNGKFKGQSVYPITNQFIEDYLKDNKNLSGDFVSTIEGNIFIPSNLTILATMNTSDQNVFPLDTAFKRRWDMEKIEPNWADNQFKDKFIPFTNITWQDFATSVNRKMVRQSTNGLILEDKQIGPYFANEDMFTDENEDAIREDIEKNNDTIIDLNKERLKKFVNNVVDYIWTDVAKFDRENWFIEDKYSFNDVYEAILSYAADISDENEKARDFCMKVTFNNNQVVESDEESDD